MRSTTDDEQLNGKTEQSANPDEGKEQAECGHGQKSSNKEQRKRQKVKKEIKRGVESETPQKKQ